MVDLSVLLSDEAGFGFHEHQKPVIHFEL